MDSRFGLEQYPRGVDIPGTDLLLLQGGARAGKGETGKAIYQELKESGLDVIIIDQGKKFRSLAYMAIHQGVDMENSLELSRYLGADTTPLEMLDFLATVNDMDDTEEKATLYTPEIGSASGKVGSSGLSHGLAVDLMFREVEVARDNKVDTVIIDGRSLDNYAKIMDGDGLGVFIGSFFLECDPLVAARRVRKDFRDLGDMKTDDKLDLLEEAEKITKRNHADAIRNVDPLRYPHHAFSLDLLRGLPTDQQTYRKMMEQIIKSKIISVKTSHTTCIEQMTRPIVAITQYMLRAAALEREQWQAAPVRFARPSNVL